MQIDSLPLTTQTHAINARTPKHTQTARASYRRFTYPPPPPTVGFSPLTPTFLEHFIPGLLTFRESALGLRPELARGILARVTGQREDRRFCGHRVSQQCSLLSRALGRA